MNANNRIRIELELDPEQHEKFVLLIDTLQLPSNEVALWLLTQYVMYVQESARTDPPMNYSEFEERLRKLELDMKLLLHDAQAHNKRYDQVVKIVRADDSKEN